MYAVGIVLYEMLAGRRPWEGDSAAAIAIARLSGPIPAPSSVRAGIPPILEAIDRKALARNAIDRFQSASAMANALESFLAGRPVAEVAGEVGAAAGAGVVALESGSGRSAGGSSSQVSRVNYPDDAYARPVEGRAVPAGRAPDGR